MLRAARVKRSIIDARAAHHVPPPEHGAVVAARLRMRSFPTAREDI